MCVNIYSVAVILRDWMQCLLFQAFQVLKTGHLNKTKNYMQMSAQTIEAKERKPIDYNFIFWILGGH